MSILFLVGRIIFGGYFLLNAYDHLFKGSHMVSYAAAKGVPMPKLAIFGSGLLLLVGGLSVLLGFYTVIGLVALLLFLFPVTFVMHAYWKISDPMARMGERVQFRKNAALIGAVLMMFALATPWMYSI